MVFIITIGFLACLRHLFNFAIPTYSNEGTPTLEEAPKENILLADANTELQSTAEEKPEVPASSNQSEETSDTSDQPDFSNTPDLTDLENDSLAQLYEDSLRQDSLRKRNTALFKKSGKIWDYDECLPDTQDQHISTATKHGITPVATHKAVLWKAQHHQLVSITESPFYVVEKLDYSLPYLVPKAKDLLTTISVNFIDSLQSKGYKPYLPIVTSVLRTTLDVRKLTRRNRNATDNSCHSYGTTFDITYSRYMPLTGIPTPVDSAEWKRSELKLVLAEVLYDLRNEGRCFVKHEHRQPCFHITVR